MNIQLINLNLLNQMRGKILDPLLARKILGIHNLKYKNVGRAVIMLPSIKRGTTDKITPGLIRMVLHQVLTKIDSRRIRIVNDYDGDNLEHVRYLNLLSFAMREEINSKRLVS